MSRPRAIVSLPFSPAARRVLAAALRAEEAELRSTLRRMDWPSAVDPTTANDLLDVRRQHVAAATERAQIARDLLRQYDDAQAANLEAVLAASVAAAAGD